MKKYVYVKSITKSQIKNNLCSATKTAYLIPRYSLRSEHFSLPSCVYPMIFCWTLHKDSPFFGKISTKSGSWNKKVESHLLQLTVLASLAVSKHMYLTSVTTVKQPSETVPHFAALLMMLHHDVSVVRSLKRRRNLPHCTALMLSQLTCVLQFENTQGSFILELIKLKKRPQ